jgi:hypothetical protein
MKDKQAKLLETRLKDLPKEPEFEFRRLSFPRGLSELQSGERADVSWITEESPDRLGDVVLARGMDDSHFQLNPIVTLNHHYDRPPVGRSLWRRKVKEGSLCGIKAKTHYPPKPQTWTGGDWWPDLALDLVQTGLLRGKSIGFFPLKIRTPTTEEIQQHPHLKNVRFIIEEWLLAEYACCYLPVQPHAVVEQVTKSLPGEFAAALGESFGADAKQLLPAGQGSDIHSFGPQLNFTALGEIEKSIQRTLRSQDVQKIIQKILQLTWEKRRGRV